MTSDTYVVVLAGGSGTRLWPASRARRPKQLLPLAGDEPLLRQTVTRVLPLLGADGDSAAAWKRVLIASVPQLARPIAGILPELPPDNLLIEPAARNTAPCIGWAAARVARADPDAVVVVLPSDHHVTGVERFRDALRRAVETARSGTVCTLGIRPTRPDTGFGYIELEEGAAADGVRTARRFVEKPDEARAREFASSGRHVWNAGMFVFRARDMLAAVAAHLPALAEGLAALDEAAAAGDEQRVLERLYPRFPAVSIDHGVMDHLSGFSVVPGEFGWSDLGSWQSVWELAAKDDHGNAAPSGAILLDAHGNQVVDLPVGTDDAAVIALVGVRDLVVVRTADALLVMPRERAQDVKQVIDRLVERGETQRT